ncbi:unnamed protein product, partial [marine sediment metagenome]
MGQRTGHLLELLDRLDTNESVGRSRAREPDP